MFTSFNPKAVIADIAAQKIMGRREPNRLIAAAQRMAPKIPPKLYAVKPMPDIAGDNPSVANMVGSQL